MKIKEYLINRRVHDGRLWAKSDAKKEKKSFVSANTNLIKNEVNLHLALENYEITLLSMVSQEKARAIIVDFLVLIFTPKYKFWLLPW